MLILCDQLNKVCEWDYSIMQRNM